MPRDGRRRDAIVAAISTLEGRESATAVQRAIAFVGRSCTLRDFRSLLAFPPLLRQVSAKETRRKRMVEPNRPEKTAMLSESRNTRQVVAVRLAEAERAQVVAAAAVRGVPPCSFVREAALAASAVVTGRVMPVRRRA